MNDGKHPQQVPSNADGNSRETHDDESALHSDWGSDESIHESLGDGRPRDAIDEHQGDLQDRDDPDGNLLTESGARSSAHRVGLLDVPEHIQLLIHAAPTRYPYLYLV